MGVNVRLNMGAKPNSYGIPGNSQKRSFNSNSLGVSSKPHSDLRRMLTTLKNEEKGIVSNDLTGSSALSSTLSYSESLRMQRQQAKSTSLKLKKLKYQFKDISSQIVRSKTSSTARQVVNKAKREVLRLKREKQSGCYDSEEIEAAIAHAKTMERIAKKKVKHLEEEEMAKASGGPCSGDMVDNEEVYSEDVRDAEYDKEIDAIAPDRDMEASDLSMDDYVNSDSVDYLTELMGDLSSELLVELSEGMRDMLEELGLDELTEGMMPSGIDMDPEDIDEMKSKHRNKEMKEIAKADAEYLKALFEHFQKVRSSGAIPGMGNAGGQTGTIDISAAPSASYVLAGNDVPSSCIDVAL